MQSENIGEIAKALAAAQAEIKDPIKTKTGKVSGTTKAGKFYEYEYKYADLADVLKNTRDALSRHGIAISQPTVVHDNVLLVQTKLMHASGEWMLSDYPVCSISGEHQKMGAALTYAKRYALTSMVGVAADDDTDGQGASEVEAPKRKSSAALKREGVWEKLERELKQADSVEEVDAIQRRYQANEYPNWNQTFREQAEEEFDKARGDDGSGKRPGEALTLREQLTGSLEAELAPIAATTRADYVQAAHDAIEQIGTVESLRAWWNAEKPARKRFRLTPAEEFYMEERCKLRAAAIQTPPPATFVPNARARAEEHERMKDKAGNELHPLEAG